MVYQNVFQETFLSRPNRFIAEIEIFGVCEMCHVKNTGRCKELLVPGARVYVDEVEKPERVTKYDLISVWKGNRIVNVDSQAPNKVFMEYLQSGQYIEGITHMKREATHGNSRFDFYVEAGERKLLLR